MKRRCENNNNITHTIFAPSGLSQILDALCDYSSSVQLNPKASGLRGALKRIAENFMLCLRKLENDRVKPD